jgi:hypothetical protein
MRQACVFMVKLPWETVLQMVLNAAGPTETTTLPYWSMARELTFPAQEMAALAVGSIETESKTINPAFNALWRWRIVNGETDFFTFILKSPL